MVLIDGGKRADIDSHINGQCIYFPTRPIGTLMIQESAKHVGFALNDRYLRMFCVNWIYEAIRCYVF